MFLTSLSGFFIGLETPLGKPGIRNKNALITSYKK